MPVYNFRGVYGYGWVKSTNIFYKYSLGWITQPTYDTGASIFNGRNAFFWSGDDGYMYCWVK